MTAYAQLQRLRLFLEGVEVPVIAADIQAMPNAPVAASIQIPPLPNGTDFLPRTLVHLFFYDQYDAAPAFDYIEKESLDDRTIDVDNNNYKLLFGGELVGYQWTKSGTNRSLILQCTDWSNYWDSAQQWNNTDLFGPGLKAMFSGGATSLFTDFMQEPGGVVLNLIKTPSIQYPKLKGLLGGIVHMLEAIGGSYYYKEQFAGENLFYSLAELRLHITQMITAYEDDPTASRLIGEGYDSLFGRTLGGLGQQVSYRQAMNALMGMIFHETYGQPCPAYHAPSGNTPSGKTRAGIRSHPVYYIYAKFADEILNNIDATREYLSDSINILPPGFDPGKLALLKATLEYAQQGAQKTANIMRDPEIVSLKPNFLQAAEAFSAALASLRKVKDVAATAGAVTHALNKAELAMRKVLNAQIISSSKEDVPARLNQHIFRPDVWFSAPPRCNVLFPEMYTSLTYSQSFLAEPTRLLLKTNDEFFGEDELFDNFYVTPRSLTVKDGKQASLASLTSNDLLDHELFTGIIPVFEKMGELNIFGARAGKVNGQTTGKKPKIGLAERSANFLYFKYRFGARTLQVSGRFNPYIACGFPALIIDKWVDEDLLKAREELIAKAGGVTPELNKLMGTHFLANVTQLSHTVSQSAGTTSMNCGYARKTDETAEFLGVLKLDQTVQKRFDKDASRTTVVAALHAPQLNSLGPNQGNITNIEDVTRVHQAESIDSPNALPVFQGGSADGQTRANIQVPVGLTLMASEYGQAIVDLVGSGNTIVTFRAYKVTEDVPRYRKEKVDLPAEEYIRPGWYGDVWHPLLIGKAYQQFFKTGSITDEQQVTTNIKTITVGGPQEKAAEVLAAASAAKSKDDPAVNGPGLLALDTNSSVAAATAFLVQTYSYVKTRGLDVDAFVSTYTWRPIATMVDMFGSADLKLAPDGISILQGVEGFHSRAFGDIDDFFGLVLPDVEKVLGIKRDSEIAKRSDTRGRKRRAVLEYLAQISYGRAILG